ncbi:MAG: hypothetical protein GAK28_02441 [Luteibacter sp.]|uniref:hypothetical protein n=1 Tax=Luteibacter sp. TaxID=1886636 RepID=UPI00137F4F40|nr:hypothetical protein [Luteibacter sp.]KAF1006765.1 MAG: hypothetical protein GAK28_02441 [Luteibacter sp.]
MKRPAPQADKIAGVLAEGPATTAEINAELAWPRKLLVAHLCAMARRGRVRGERMGNDHPTRKLWTLIGDEHA